MPNKLPRYKLWPASMTPKQRCCNLCGEGVDISFLYKRNGYTILRCNSCGLVYLADIPSQEVLSQLYSTNFFRSTSKFKNAPNNPSRINAIARVEWILETATGVGRDAWLDIGCASGEFLLAAKNHVRALHGNDVSAFAVEQAKKYGLTHLRVGDFASLKYKPAQYDLISMWDVLEHVRDPKAFLKKAYRLLKPNGYLVLSTGDVDSLTSRIMGRFWHLMIPPFHTHYFSAKTLHRYLDKTGFSQITITYPGKHVPLDFMISKTLRLINPSWSDMLSNHLSESGLAHIRPKINLFDIMTVIAQRD